MRAYEIIDIIELMDLGTHLVIPIGEGRLITSHDLLALSAFGVDVQVLILLDAYVFNWKRGRP